MYSIIVENKETNASQTWKCRTAIVTGITEEGGVVSIILNDSLEQAQFLPFLACKGAEKVIGYLHQAFDHVSTQEDKALS